ncbi:MAG: MBOAT family protein, partial [Bacteroidales bacterium]|nr:MBOAT family protein [Bacteroidales bacterium]
MLFNSFYYFVFLGIVFILYYAVGNKLKWLILLIASLFFIGTIAPNLIIFTLLFTVINYFFGIALFNIKNKPLRIKVFWLGIFINVGILAFYKYINFLIENVNFLLTLFPENPSIPYISVIIPVGISYYTFQALGYLIRINRGAEKPEKDFIKFATFLTFFPKFLAGPVERSNHFFPQANSKIEFKSENVTIGLRLFLWGMFKKVVIGNNLVAPIFGVYDDLYQFSGIPLITVLLIQAIHIYCDFSGYTDMALGSAKILGINLIDNFNRPFLAKNVGDFWRRWHISLSAWCNDFIFSPFIVKYRKMGNK